MLDEVAVAMGARLRALREAQGLSRGEVARELSVDITTVRGWERGQYRPRPHRLRQLSKLLDVSCDHLRNVMPVGVGVPAQSNVTLVDTIADLPPLLNRLLGRTTRVLKALRLAAPYSTPAHIQCEFRKLISERLLAGTIEVQRIEIIYTLDRLREVISNIIRYEGCAYHYKAYCPGMTEVSPAMGGYFFDDEDFLIGAYWTGVPPHDRPGLHMSGEPFRSYFRAYWDEIWHRGTHMNGGGAHDLSKCRDVALQLGLKPEGWTDFVESARSYDIGDGIAPLV